MASNTGFCKLHCEKCNKRTWHFSYTQTLPTVHCNDCNAPKEQTQEMVNQAITVTARLSKDQGSAPVSPVPRYKPSLQPKGRPKRVSCLPSRHVSGPAPQGSRFCAACGDPVDGFLHSSGVINGNLTFSTRDVPTEDPEVTLQKTVAYYKKYRGVLCDSCGKNPAHKLDPHYSFHSDSSNEDRHRPMVKPLNTRFTR